jgi:hypothetical protein
MFAKKNMFGLVLCAFALALGGCGQITDMFHGGGENDNIKGTQTTQYTVAYNANNGTGTAPSAQTALAGTSVVIPNQGALTRVDYTFTEWNTAEDGTGTSHSPGSSFVLNSN